MRMKVGIGGGDIKEGNRSRKGWKRGRRKNCGINEKEEVQRIKKYMHRLEAVEEV